MKYRLFAGVSALALLCAAGTGAAYANPTLKNVEGVSYNEGPVAIGSVDISVSLMQNVEGIEAGDASGGAGGSSDGGSANGVDGALAGIGGDGGTGAGAGGGVDAPPDGPPSDGTDDPPPGENGAVASLGEGLEWTTDGGGGGSGGQTGGGTGGEAGTGGNARATNISKISIENGNVAAISGSELYALNALDFEDFIDTGDNDPEASGGSAEGGEGGDASGGAGASAGEDGVPYYAAAGNGDVGGGGYGASGGEGGDTTSGDVSLETGAVSYGVDAFRYAAGQFSVSGNTAIAGINQGGNAAAVHVPINIPAHN